MASTPIGSMGEGPWPSRFGSGSGSPRQPPSPGPPHLLSFYKQLKGGRMPVQHNLHDEFLHNSSHPAKKHSHRRWRISQPLFSAVVFGPSKTCNALKPQKHNCDVSHRIPKVPILPCQKKEEAAARCRTPPRDGLEGTLCPTPSSAIFHVFVKLTIFSKYTEIIPA